MAFVYLTLLFWCATLQAAEEERAPATEPATAKPAVVSNAEETAESNPWPRHRVKLRAGTVTSNANPSVSDEWEIDPGTSREYALGYAYDFPGQWQRFRFTMGPEYKYILSRSELGSAAIETTITQLLFDFGVEWLPDWLGPIGLTSTIGFTVWDERSAKLKAAGFSSGLGHGPASGLNSYPAAPQIFELSFFLKIPSNWKPALTLNSRAKGSTLTLGVDYVF